MSERIIKPCVFSSTARLIKRRSFFFLATQVSRRKERVRVGVAQSKAESSKIKDPSDISSLVKSDLPLFVFFMIIIPRRKKIKAVSYQSSFDLVFINFIEIFGFIHTNQSYPSVPEFCD